MIELNTPEEIPYKIDIITRPGGVEAANMQKHKIELMRHVMNRMFRGP